MAQPAPPVSDAVALVDFGAVGLAVVQALAAGLAAVGLLPITPRGMTGLLIVACLIGAAVVTWRGVAVELQRRSTIAAVSLAAASQHAENEPGPDA